MRNIILIFSLFFSTSIFAQGKFDVQGDLAPTGQYGIVKARNLKGGYYGSVHDTVARNLIPANFRDSNMLVYTRYDTTMWMLKGGLTNANWSVFSTGGNAGAYDSLLKLNNTWLGVNKFNRQIEVDSLKGAGSLYITGNLENSSDIKAGRRLQAGKSLVGNGIFRFYNYNHNYRTDLQGDSMLTSNVDLLLPSSSGKLALTTDIAPVDTSIISTKAYVDYKDDIQQGFIDMRKLDADSIAWTGYATRARLQQQLDSASAAQAVINGVQDDSLLIHNTRILANQNAANTNAANINLKVNIADTLPMLAGYRDASILSTGTLADARLSSNVPKMVSNVLPAVDGSLLTNLNPASIATVIQTITATATINNSTTTLLVNPATVVSSLSITFCAAPYQTQIIRIVFGGTITSGNQVVTTLSILPNSGQSVVRVFPSVEAFAGDFLAFQYINTNWYQIN